VGAAKGSPAGADWADEGAARHMVLNNTLSFLENETPEFST
jgi:hypothetical protein